MPHGVTCPGCKQALALGTILIGQKLRCPRCGIVFQIGSPSKPAATTGASPLPNYLKSPSPPKSESADIKPKPLPGPVSPKMPSESQPAQPRTKSVPTRAKAASPAKATSARKRRSIVKPLLFLLLLAVFGTGVGAYFWWRPNWFGTPDDLFFLPDGCQVTAAVNVPACLASKAHQRLKKRGLGLGAGEDEAFRRFAGILLSEVTSMTFGGRFDEDPEWTVVLHTARLVTPSDLQAEGASDLKEARFGKFTVYDRGEVAFYLPNRNTLVIGKSDSLRRVLLRNKRPALATGLDSLRGGSGDKALILAFDAKAIPRQLNRLGDADLTALTAAARQADTVVLESTADPLDLRITFGCSDAPSALDAQKQLLKALEQIGRTPDLPPAVAELRKALQWTTEDNRAIAQFWLPLGLLRELLLTFKQQRPEYWIAALRDEDARQRTEARRWLLARAEQALPLLVSDLRDRTAANVRRIAAEMLGDIGEKASEAAPALAAHIGDPDPAVRHAVVVALGKIGPKVRNAAFTALLPALVDTEPDVVQAAQTALEHIGSPRGLERNVLVTTLQNAQLGVKPRLYLLDALAGMELENEVLVSILAETLQDRAAELRRQAAFQLGKQGDKLRPSILPALLSALKDSEPTVRSTVIASLDALGKFPPEEASSLIELYKDGNTPEDSRAALVRWLAAMGPEAKNAVFPILLDARSRTDPQVRKAATEALARLGTATTVDVGHLAATLKKPSTTLDNRLHAVRLLGEAGPRARQTCLLLVDLLNDKSPELRGAALAALERIGPPDEKEMRLVLLSISHPMASKEVRRYIAALLADGKVEPSQATPLLLNTLADEDPLVRRAAARSLVKLHSQSHEIVQAYDAALDDTDAEVRLQVTTALTELPPGVCPITSLVKAFADESDPVSRKAAEGLARKGKPVKDDLPTLATALRHKKARVRSYAANALSELGADAAGALTALTEAVKDTDVGVRFLALTALRAVGAKAESAVPEVAKLLKDESALVRLHAAFLLLRFHIEAKNAFPFVFEAAIDKDNTEQRLALELLDEIGPWAMDTAPYLFDALCKEETRTTAGPLLAKIGKTSVPRLRTFLTHRDASVRYEAVKTLGQIGRDAFGALQEVNKMARTESNEEARAAAKKASQQIQKRD